MLLDHLNKWIRTIRQDLLKKRESDSKRASLNSGAADVLRATAEEQLVRVDSILSNIDQGLMANAASQCKAYARALMNLEHQIRLQRETNASKRRLQRQYERLHELYALLEEPDGMEGVSPLILSPSLEHQIREHESTGRWTSAQSCWEVRLQHDPDNLDSHLGLLRCLRNLGHYGAYVPSSSRVDVNNAPKTPSALTSRVSLPVTPSGDRSSSGTRSKANGWSATGTKFKISSTTQRLAHLKCLLRRYYWLYVRATLKPLRHHSLKLVSSSALLSLLLGKRGTVVHTTLSWIYISSMNWSSLARLSMNKLATRILRSCHLV